MKLMSILCLMMILHSGCGSPVAGEGNSDSGLGFVAAVADTFFPLLTSIVSDKITEDSQHKVDDEIERGRSYNMGSVNYLGFVLDAADSSVCCEKCNKKYEDTEFFGFSYKTFLNSRMQPISKCSCMKSKPGFQVSTRPTGFETGKCGTWSYNGDGELGLGRYISGGVSILGVANNVALASSCCDSCTEKFPSAQLFDFSSQNKQCKCYITKSGGTPSTSTRIREHSIGTCDQVLEAESATEKLLSASDTTAPATQGPVHEPGASAEESPQSNALPGSDQGSASDNRPVAEALTITTPQPAPAEVKEICDGKFPCCPHLSDGDNTLGTEKFVQESQYKAEFSSCAEACQKLHPFSNGVTQSKTQKYKGNQKPLCWCEYGEAKFHGSTGYQTCLFKPQEVQEADYEY